MELNPIPYAEAIVKALWNYYRMSDYSRVWFTGVRHGTTHYDNVEQLWKDALNAARNDEGELRLSAQKVIRLVGFNFTEWFPWQPGMYWTPYGQFLRYVGERTRDGVLGRDIQTDKELIHLLVKLSQ